jgi:hypothetical protein
MPRESNIVVSNKFTAVPLEKGTNILFELNATLDDCDVLYQMWCWDGITAESFIFLSSDIADLTDEKLKALAKSSPMIKADSELTLVRHVDGYTFVNFNFIAD